MSSGWRVQRTVAVPENGRGLSLSDGTVLKRELITAGRGRLLFSSGSMISRSKEIKTLSRMEKSEQKALRGPY